MKNIIKIAIISGLLFACNNTHNSESEVVSEEQVAAVTPQLDIASFDIDAGKYVDAEVEVSGIVDHVCKHSGKKLLLVTDGAKVHVESETRFDDTLVGNPIKLKGIVRELRVDESYCLQMEDDNTKKHKEGESNDEQFTQKQKLIQSYRDSMTVAGVDHLSFYTLDFVALEKGTE